MQLDPQPPLIDQSVQPPAPAQQSMRSSRKHSALGVASFIISLAAPVMLIVLTIVVTVTAVGAERENIHEKVPLFAAAGLGMMACLGAMLVGLGLGIAGCCQKKRKKVFAVLGTVFNAAMVLGIVALMAARQVSH